MGTFKVIFYTKGRFAKNPNLTYEGGEVYAFTGQDTGSWSFFDSCDLIMSIDPGFDYKKVRMWWKHVDGSLENDLNSFRDDNDAFEMAASVHNEVGDIEIYVEHKPSTRDATFMKNVRKRKKGIMDEGGDEPKGDEGSSFAEGFEKDESNKQPNADDADVADSSEGMNPSLITPEMGKKHVIEDEYLTDEFDSGAEDDSDDDRPRVVRLNEEDGVSKDFKIKVGMEFSSLRQFKTCILEHNVLNGRDVRFEKNDAVRCRVVCKEKGQCNYTVLCSKVLISTTFKIKTLFAKHKCGRQFFNKSAKAEWVAKVIVDRMKNCSKMKLNDVIEYVRVRYATEIPGCRAFKARQIAKRVVEGDSSKQYSLLWSYEAELRRASPGNTFKMNIQTPGPGLLPRFERCYLCFDGTKKALKLACRPFIGLDECHLKHKYGGILLIAVGRDPNDQYLPLAFGVVETESKDTWSWFMELLLQDIGEKRWCFISYQQKGLVQVFEEQYPAFEHRFCVSHLYANFKKKFGGGTLFRGLMLAAAKATYVEAHQQYMHKIKEASNDAFEWLEAIPKSKWCKHVFPLYSKCDVLMNNLSESFNATILLQRDKSIITMFEWIRSYLMGRFATLREKVGYKGRIMSKPLRRLDREIKKSVSWTATYAGRLTFQVTHVMFTDSFVVELAKHTCSCNFWDLIGIPCRHAISAIHRKVDDPIDYVHQYYHKSTYVKCYEEDITPLKILLYTPTIILIPIHIKN
ncbi:uncharacterized protein LOC131650398 [Vicia villosa]|uniref:uncharacterized protein LOC131650398 n=1 Tax=Vicia villosa TaxID=3911 RepID=UPI00273A8DE0|nr:uncharacterized protein LOC131650398 [Vicia villosa]